MGAEFGHEAQQVMNSGTPSWRIILLDHCLARPGGHSFTLAQAALEADANILIYANMACEMEDPRIKKTFLFSDMHPDVRFPSVSIGGIAKRLGFYARVLARILRANFAFASQIDCNKDAPTIWFAVNGSLRNVFALLAKSWMFPRDVFICYLLQDPGRSLKLIELLRQRAGFNNFHFAAETEELAGLVTRMTGARCRVAYFPCPSIQTKNDGSGHSPPPVAGFLGMPRREKGFDILVQAIKKLEPELQSGAVRFRLQAPPAYLELERLNEEHKCLLKLKEEVAGIDLVEEELDGHAYTALLQSCDFLIIPYRVASYARRSSLVPIEGLLNGKPLILTKGIMVTESLPDDCGQLFFTDGDAASLAETIRTMISDFSMYSAKCNSISTEWKHRYSPEAFVETLLAIANSPIQASGEHG